MTHLAVWVIKFYQRAVSPFIPHSCRFTPTCSAYFLEAVEMRGFFKGSLLGLKRISRCHFLDPGGYDPVKVK
jgi:putative membrane protein insertion efficiency factor